MLEDNPLAIPKKNLAIPILIGFNEYNITNIEIIEITSVRSRAECVRIYLVT